MRGDKARFLLDLCADRGWGLTLFDYRGHGESSGLAEEHDLHDWLADLQQVLIDCGTAQVIIGSSMGAWLAVHAAMAQPQRIRSMITIAAAPDFTQELLYPALNSEQQLKLDEGQLVSIPTQYEDQPWRINAELIRSGEALSLFNRTSKISLPFAVRMLHGTSDMDVPWHFSQRLQALMECPDASLTLIHEADHRLSDKMSLSHLRTALLSVAA